MADPPRPRRPLPDASKLALLAEKTVNGVVLADAEGRVEWVNEGFTRITGYTLDDVIGRKPGHVLQGPDTDGATVEYMRAQIARGEAFHVEILNYAKDQHAYWIDLVVQPIRDDQGRLVNFMGVQSDITVRRKAEAALHEARAQAEAATAAKSAFVANMSHEIRTPMNAVIGMTSVLLSTPLSAEQREFVETIRRSGETLLALTNDILDLSKIESGRLEVERTRFSVRDCVDAALSLVAHWAEGKRLTLAASIDPGVPAGIVGDATRVRQVLANLLTNAVKFTERGEIAVSVAARRLAGLDYEIEFAVRDTGIGIPADRMDRLFKTFSQVDTSTTRNYGGTGLGLAICRRLCEMMGGRIWAESQEGRGSTFRFTIRAQSSGQPSEAPAASASRDLETTVADRFPLRLLVVEDNVINQRVALLLLSRMGYRADIANNGVEAVEAVGRQPYDVVLMDVQMPQMDGLDATRLLRRSAPPAVPWIIGMTADATVEARDACLSAGMNDYITKPVEPYRLQDALERVGRALAHEPGAGGQGSGV